MRTIFHLDLDAFFVSVERIINPALIGKPVIVGADPESGRGVVAACSYEAREYGLHSAMPIRQAYRLCPNGIYIQGYHGEYSRYSEAVRKILEKYAPMIEQASVDEFYMDFTGTHHIYGSYFQFATKLQSEIKEKLSLPCSIGIATNKTIAKIASDFKKPEGITHVIPGTEKEFLEPMAVETIPGVGKATLKELRAKGFYKVSDITKQSEEYMATALGKHGKALWHKAHGEGPEYLNPPTARKSISKERTYGKDVVSKNTIESTLFDLTGKVCQILRDKNWQTSTISIKLRYSDFTTLTRSKTIDNPTDDDQVVFNTAVNLFRKAYTRRVGVRLIGIHLSKFTEFSEQGILFENKSVTREEMFKAINKIRSKYGYSSIKLGNR